MLFQTELETEGSRLATIFDLPPTPRHARISRLRLQVFMILLDTSHAKLSGQHCKKKRKRERSVDFELTAKGDDCQSFLQSGHGYRLIKADQSSNQDQMLTDCHFCHIYCAQMK